MDSWWSDSMTETRFEPARVRLDAGVPGQSAIVHRFLVQGDAGDKITLRYSAEKAADIEMTIRLESAE
jgi:hypothetical protein